MNKDRDKDATTGLGETLGKKVQESGKAEQNCCNDRIKTFEECGIEEKLVRLNIVVRELRQGLSYAHRTINEQRLEILALQNHQHTQNGDCVIKLRDSVNHNQHHLGGAVMAAMDLLS